jgi:hypothetical protein
MMADQMRFNVSLDFSNPITGENSTLALLENYFSISPH